MSDAEGLVGAAPRASRAPRRAAAAASLALFAVLAAPRAAAVVLSEDELGEESTDLGVVFRSFTLLYTGEVLEPPFSSIDSSPLSSSLFDARVMFEHKTPALKLVLANDLFLRSSSAPLESGVAGLGFGATPDRWMPLSVEQRQPDRKTTLTLGSDADWLYGAYRFERVTLTVGRQPVTLGRGTIWHPEDVVSTFSLTEIDTAYKPGVDALRVDLSLGERTELSLLGVIGWLEVDDSFPPQPLPEKRGWDANWRGSSALVVAKQGWESGEVGVLGGMVRYDWLAGVDALVSLDDVDLYGEVTANWLVDAGRDSLPAPGARARGEEQDGTVILRGNVGARWRPLEDLTVTPEAYYNGFGAKGASDYWRVAMSQRATLGEQQGWGRWYAGVIADWKLGALTEVAAAMLGNLQDPSGLGFVNLRRNLAENVDVSLGAYLPVGEGPALAAGSLLPELQSEYGSYPRFFFAELVGSL